MSEHRPDFTVFRKEILLDGYVWSLELHLNNIYSDTSAAVGLKEAICALGRVTALVRMFNTTDGGKDQTE